MKNWMTSSAKALQNTLVSRRKKTRKSNAFKDQKISVGQLSAIKGGEDRDILIVAIIGG